MEIDIFKQTLHNCTRLDFTSFEGYKPSIYLYNGSNGVRSIIEICFHTNSINVLTYNNDSIQFGTPTGEIILKECMNLIISVVKSKHEKPL